MSDNQIIGAGTARDPQWLPLATKLGNAIKNRRRPEKSSQQLMAAVVQLQTLLPGLKARSVSSTYNCFGMVFASRRTWILDGEEVSKILYEDGYRKIENRADVVVGDVVIYRNDNAEITHAGVVFEKEIAMQTGDINFTILSPDHS